MATILFYVNQYKLVAIPALGGIAAVAGYYSVVAAQMAASLLQ